MWKYDCGWRAADCTPTEAVKLAMICVKYGIDYTITTIAEPEPEPMTLRRWAGQVHATVQYVGHRDRNDGGRRSFYQCSYASRGTKAFGPVRRNPVDAMQAAMEQDQKRRSNRKV